MSRVLDRYRALVAAGELRADPDQEAAAGRLDTLQQELEAAPPRGSTLWKLLRKAPEPPRGLYMWGGVGRGKSTQKLPIVSTPRRAIPRASAANTAMPIAAETKFCVVRPTIWLK